MKCVNGIWYHRGQSYATLWEALAAVWPQAAGQKKAALVLAHQSGKVKKVSEMACFISENITRSEGLQV